MKHLLKLFSILIVLLSINACSDDPLNPNVTFSATLDGASVATPTGSTATGLATLVFNTTTKVYTITVTHSGIATITNGHIHKGAVGTSGGPAFDAFSSFDSPITQTSDPLTEAQEADLNAHLYYVNLHSAAFPGGEIRGQLIKQ